MKATRIRKILLATAVLWIGLSLPVVAQQQMQSGQTGKNSNQMQGTKAQAGQAPSAIKKDLQQVSGKVTELKDFSIAGFEKNNMFAKLQTREGKTVRVNLGPLDQVEKLSIDKGDQITVYGTEGSVNEKPTFFALAVKTQEGQQMIQRDYDRNLKKVQAKVLKTRTVQFKQNKVPEQVLARIQIQNGPTTVVNLGAKQNMPKDLKLEGKEVAMLARPAKIGGKNALVAEQIRVDGQTIQVDHPVVGRQSKQQTGAAGKSDRP